MSVYTEWHIVGDVQLSNQFAGMGVSNESASTPSASSNPSQDRQAQTPGPHQASRPSSTLTGSLKATGSRQGSRHKSKAASHAKPDHEQPNLARDPQPPGDGTSMGSHAPARGVGRKAWACEQCGVTAEGLEKGKLQECSGCHSVRYCGKACQDANWPTHKPKCKRLQAAR
jgi:hypothetical protein